MSQGLSRKPGTGGPGHPDSDAWRLRSYWTWGLGTSGAQPRADPPDSPSLSPEGPHPELNECEPPESNLCPEIQRGALTARSSEGPEAIIFVCLLNSGEVVSDLSLSHKTNLRPQEGSLIFFF